MKVLVIKTSSMGDVIHTFPALTDAGDAIENIQFDWVVEDCFSEIPKWHPLVDKVICVALRQWRSKPMQSLLFGDVLKAIKSLRKTKYDLIIDSQGLLKSAIMSLFAKGTRIGYNKTSIRELLALPFYHKRIAVNPNEHAVTRTRKFFAKALNYQYTNHAADYGFDSAKFTWDEITLPTRYLVFLHNTTWPSKHWPEQFWVQLTKYATSAGFHVLLPWGVDKEYERAKRIAKVSTLASIPPRMNLKNVAAMLVKAQAVVAVDTGIAHLSAALAVPTITLYGPTDAKLTGTVGENQIHLSAHFNCSPCLQKQCRYRGQAQVKPACFATVTPKVVWEQLQQQMKISC